MMRGGLLDSISFTSPTLFSKQNSSRRKIPTSDPPNGREKNPTNARCGEIKGIFLFHPTVPGYPKARFPGVVLFAEIYQGECVRWGPRNSLGDFSCPVRIVPSQKQRSGQTYLHPVRVN